MSLIVPSFAGIPMFGQAVRIQMIPEPCAAQIESFFGLNGAFSVFGGSRTRIFQIEGCLFDITIPALNSDEDLFTPNVSGSMANGVANVLIDTRGRAWANVIYLGEWQPDPMGPRPAVSGGLGGWALPYKAVFRGLS